VAAPRAGPLRNGRVIQPPDESAQSRKPAPLWLLGFVATTGTLAMHIFVPALPHAAADLGASVGAMQLTISLYIFGLAVGQLIYGPLSDRFGRRPVLMGGLALYTAAGLGAAFAPHANALIAARLFQALGGCSALVLGRAIVRDTSLPQEAARRLAAMNLMTTLAPGVAPLIGGALASTAGWRSIFALLAVLGVLNVLVTWRLLPETAKPSAGTSVRSLARNYAQLIVSPKFLAYSVGGGCATTSMYAFIAAAPFIFVNQLHRPAYEVGVYLAVMISGVWIGSVLATRLIVRMPLTPPDGARQPGERGIGVRPARLHRPGPVVGGCGGRGHVRLHAGRRHGGADRHHVGGQRQPAGHRVRFGPLRIRTDGAGRAVHRPRRYGERSGARRGAGAGRVRRGFATGVLVCGPAVANGLNRRAHRSGNWRWTKSPKVRAKLRTGAGTVTAVLRTGTASDATGGPKRYQAYSLPA
jgi:Bcr/CflA subfamily drug resistance transporter